MADLLAGVGLGPERLALALLVVRHHRAGRFQNVLGRAVILLQADGVRVGKVVLEIENVADVGAAPAVDRLVFVAHHADVRDARWDSSRISSYWLRLVS